MDIIWTAKKALKLSKLDQEMCYVKIATHFGPTPETITQTQDTTMGIVGSDDEHYW